MGDILEMYIETHAKEGGKGKQEKQMGGPNYISKNICFQDGLEQFTRTNLNKYKEMHVLLACPSESQHTNSSTL